MSDAQRRKLLALAEELDGEEGVERVGALLDLGGEVGLVAAQAYLRELVDELVKDHNKEKAKQDYVRIGIPWEE